MFTKFTFPKIISYSALGICLYLFYTKKVIAQFKARDKMIGHWRAPTMKKPPFFYARALVTRGIMRSKDAQCNTIKGLTLNRRFNGPTCRDLEQRLAEISIIEVLLIHFNTRGNSTSRMQYM